VVVEQTHKEAFAPVVKLRKILLACVFGTFGVIALLVVPMAHFSVLPIRRLRDATEKSVQPPGYTPSNSVRSDGLDDPGYASGEEEGIDEEHARSPSSQRSKRRGILIRLKDFRRGSRRKSKAEKTEDARRRVFKIPGKVQDRKHFVTDELTELTGTFNEMSDELMMQYARLEDKVEERTRELEMSKKAAEAANESKTLFIANISHELKTPLNGILGMCAVCMGEDDLPRIKKSLQVVYKSGDLLLHLLNDLLTFTKNQIGQSLSLEEKEFGLSDIKSQIVTIFDKQVREGHINFGVNFISSDSIDFTPERPSEKPSDHLPALGPQGTGRLKDMRLWGDQHRILQVIINLVSNSLKFTPEGGKVEVRIKCLGEVERSTDGNSRKDSFGSKAGSQTGSHKGSGRGSRNRHRVGSGSNTSVGSKVPSTSAPSKQMGTALLINPMDPKLAQTHIHIQERSQTPPPANARLLMFQIEVEDTGPGIPDHLQQRVFEPFEQGDLGLSRKYGGTGLGLSICSQLATLMGGSISLESTEGVGTTFEVRIPLKFVKERASSTTSSDAHGSRPPSILGPDDLRSGKLPGDPTTGSNTPLGFEKDTQPRLVGLSQPFFASTPAAATSSNSNDHMDALDRIAAAKSGTMGKVRVLVAEDNLVNQEVVLR
jgi:osomolarity two-component system sensor histidine kinase SLN1